jgi:hypothetical protein
MCKHVLIYAPSKGYFSRDGDEVTILGFLHAEGVSEEQVALFEQEVQGCKVERPGPWIEVRRTVRVATREGLRNQAAQLGLDIRDYFTPEKISYYH